ncbi:MAG TPA: nuclear transport factor 2 family protein [Cyclobacteriaceae bacterium]
MKTTATQHESIDALSKKGTCIEFFSAYQDLDLDRMLGLCSLKSEVAFEPLGDAGKGKIHEIGKNIWSAIIDSFPDIDNTVKSQTFNESDNSVTCLVAIFGTQEKEFAGLPSKGLRFDSDHIFIFKFDDQSKIDTISINWNQDEFVKQLTK